MTNPSPQASELEILLLRSDISNKKNQYHLAHQFVRYFLDHGLHESPYKTPAILLSSGVACARMSALLETPRFSNTIQYHLRMRAHSPLAYTLHLRRQQNGGLVVLGVRDDASFTPERKRFYLWDERFGKE